jgi:hypothetical protein
MVIGAGFCVVGAVVSHVLAPETTGKSLSTTGGWTAITPKASAA